MSRISYRETPAFQRDLARLIKRFRSLREDLELAKKAAVELYHLGGIDNRSVFPIPGYGSGQCRIYKIKKFACKALKGKGAKSGIRVIYAFHSSTARMDLLELYYKGDQASESRDRIDAYPKKE